MSTVISVRVGRQIKTDAQAVAESLGFSLSSLINAYLRQLIATRRVDFFAPEPMTPKLEKLIGQAESDIHAEKLSRAFDNADDFLSDLKS